MSQILTAGNLIRTKELVTIGLEKDFGRYFRKESPFTSELKINNFDSSFSAWRWLIHCEKSGIKGRLPKAVICDFSLLKNDKFLLYKNIQTNANLKKIPFIAFNTAKEDLRKEALEGGMDDCYNLPLEWDNLSDRIDFLEKYKPEFASQKEEQPESLGFKMPWSKRALDIAVSLGAIICLSPLLIPVMLAVKFTSKGPIFYKSKRVGTGYQVFDFWKFRSMYVDADSRLEEIQHLNQYAQEEELNGKNGSDKNENKGKGAVFQKFKNDPRITPVGRFIRMTSIDELPQIFNVLRGEMSIVGNRPLPLYEAEQLTVDEWVQRFRAPAGITGLWQISKRGTDDMSAEERIALDIEYSENYSFWNDLKIILKTPFAMIQKEDV